MGLIAYDAIFDVPNESAPGGSSVPLIRTHRLTWAALLARVFALDVTVCPACGGRLRLIAALTEPESIRRYLQGVDLPTEHTPAEKRAIRHLHRLTRSPKRPFIFPIHSRCS